MTRPLRSGRHSSASARERSAPFALRDHLAILEPRELLQEGQLDGPDRPVPLLGDDHVGEPPLVAVLLVVLLTVEKHDHIGVLLNCARVVTHDAVCEPGRRPRYGEIEHLGLTRGFDRDDSIPEDVVLNFRPQRRTVEQASVACKDVSRWREAEVRYATVARAAKSGHRTL